MRCLKCGKEWNNRKSNPKACPVCHRYNYNIPRKWKTEVVEGPINIVPAEKVEEDPWRSV